VMVYLITKAAPGCVVEILRVLHAAQRWPPRA